MHEKSLERERLSKVCASTMIERDKLYRLMIFITKTKKFPRMITMWYMHAYKFTINDSMYTQHFIIQHVHRIITYCVQIKCTVVHCPGKKLVSDAPEKYFCIEWQYCSCFWFPIDGLSMSHTVSPVSARAWGTFLSVTDLYSWLFSRRSERRD